MVAMVRKNRNNKWYCSHCMMIQPQLRETCSFCGYMFGNIEEVWLENSNLIQEQKVKNFLQGQEEISHFQGPSDYAIYGDDVL